MANFTVLYPLSGILSSEEESDINTNEPNFSGDVIYDDIKNWVFKPWYDSSSTYLGFDVIMPDVGTNIYIVKGRQVVFKDTKISFHSTLPTINVLKIYNTAIGKKIVISPDSVGSVNVNFTLFDTSNTHTCTIDVIGVEINSSGFGSSEIFTINRSDVMGISDILDSVTQAQNDAGEEILIISDFNNLTINLQYIFLKVDSVVYFFVNQGGSISESRSLPIDQTLFDDISASFTYTATDNPAIDGLIVNTNGTWTYTTPSSYDSLGAGQTADIPVSYSVSDGNGGTGTGSFTIRVTGTNDVAVISGDTTASITETDEAQTVTGQLIISDADDGEETFVAQTDVAGDNGYGNFTIDAIGSWSYTMNSAHNEFVDGTSYTDTITVSSVDGTEQVITVTITGTNDETVGEDTVNVSDSISNYNFLNKNSGFKLVKISDSEETSIGNTYQYINFTDASCNITFTGNVCQSIEITSCNTGIYVNGNNNSTEKLNIIISSSITNKLINITGNTNIDCTCEGNNNYITGSGGNIVLYSTGNNNTLIALSYNIKLYGVDTPGYNCSLFNASSDASGYTQFVTMIGGNGNNTYGLALKPGQISSFKSYTVIDRFNTTNDSIHLLAMSGIFSADGFMSYPGSSIKVKKWGTELSFGGGLIYDEAFNSATITEGKLSFTNIRPSNIASSIVSST